MNEELSNDQSSHYEVSLTAGQAFVAFVLLLFSLAASFAFGLIIGRGQSDDRLVVRKEPTIVTEGTGARSSSRIVELGVGDEQSVTDTTATTMPMVNSSIVEEVPVGSESQNPPAGSQTETAATSTASSQPSAGSDSAAPHYAQLLSTTDRTAAEALAARLIDSGFNTAYVERNIADQGTTFRVRVKFPTEAAARAAADQLKAFAKGEVWITRQ